MKSYQLAILLTLLSNVAFADSIEKEYSLSIGSYYGYADYSKPKPSPYKKNNINSTINAYGKISYDYAPKYTASLIGYLMIDSAKEVENYNQGYWGEEVFALFETPLGELSIGQDYNVAYNFAVGAPNIGAYKVNNSDIINFINTPNWYKKGKTTSYKTLNSTYINTDGASFKFNYITPDFNGIKLGATYIPETYSQSGLVSKYSSYKDNKAYILGAYGSWYISGFDLETSLGYADYDENNKEYSLGFSLYRKGWTLGASYRKTDTNSKDAPVNKYNLYDGYRNAKAYNIGLSYEIGPFTTGVSYFNSKSDISDNKDEIYSFSNSFEYNKYTTISMTIAHLTSKDTKTTKGNAFILGLEFALWKK